MARAPTPLEDLCIRGDLVNLELERNLYDHPKWNRGVVQREAERTRSDLVRAHRRLARRESELFVVSLVCLAIAGLCAAFLVKQFM